jgi:hypothetical protein
LQETVPFPVGEHWRLVWHCQAATVERPGYVVVLEMEEADASSGNTGVKAVCEQKSISGAEEIAGEGQVCLRIICRGEWTVQVQEHKQARTRDD